MRRAITTGLCLAVILGINVTAAASASASPYIQHLFALCEKAPKEGKKDLGHYSAGCKPESKVETGGAYELVSAIGEELTEKSKLTTIYIYAPAREAEPWAGGTVFGTAVCRKSEGSGEIVSGTSSTWFVTFEGCEFDSKRCTSPGEPTGDVVTSSLNISPDLEDGKVVGVAIPQAGAETPVAEDNCEGISFVTSGAAIGELSGNVERASKTSKDTMTVNSKTGEPGIAFYEEGKEGEEGKQTPGFMESLITPPGVVLGLGMNSTLELKSKNAIGVYSQTVL